MPVLALPPKTIPFETRPLLEGVALQQPPALQCCPPPQLRVAGPCHAARGPELLPGAQWGARAPCGTRHRARVAAAPSPMLAPPAPPCPALRVREGFMGFPL